MDAHVASGDSDYFGDAQCGAEKLLEYDARLRKSFWQWIEKERD
jgi:hypothetical protein